jgi:hypothetical protein
MVMPKRTYSAGKGYRYGFNGQEKDVDVYAHDNTYTAEYWEYDARIGRRWNVDPKPSAANSVYATFYNNPIWNVDVLGDTSTHIDNNGKVLAVFDDGDLSIYQHQTAKTKNDVVQWREKFKNTSGNGLKVGETLIWNSFHDDETNTDRGTVSINSKAGINFMVASWKLITKMFKEDDNRRVFYALNAGGFGMFDFKTEGKSSGTPEEDLLEHKYRGSLLMHSGETPIFASARDFGNYFAGFVASKTNQDKKQFLQVAGAFNYYNENKNLLAGAILSHFNQVPIKWPTYGEAPRSNYFQRLGYHRVLGAAQLKKIGSDLWKD